MGHYITLYATAAEEILRARDALRKIFPNNISTDGQPQYTRDWVDEYFHRLREHSVDGRYNVHLSAVSALLNPRLYALPLQLKGADTVDAALKMALRMDSFLRTAKPVRLVQVEWDNVRSEKGRYWERASFAQRFLLGPAG